MNRTLTATLVAVCCLALAMTLVAQAGGDATSKVEELEKQMRQAQMNSDATWYEKHLADGYVEGHSWGEWATKADAIKQMQNKSIKFTKGGISDVKVATFGDNTAIAHYKFTYDADIGGKHRARSVICSDTWVNDSGAWKSASTHCSVLQDK